MSVHFGEHVTIDGYGGNSEKLNDRALLASAIDELCDLLKMHKLAEPQIVSAPDNHIKDPGGWSGFVMIAESHISIHTFPKRRFVSADVYTCQNGVDVDFITGYFRKKYDLEEIESHFIKRGTKYPEKNID
jgi:S-adenosylmethionine decarboxylase